MPQSLSNVLVHLVFSTKHRDRALNPEVREELFPYFIGALRNNGCPSIQVGGVEDHVHLLFQQSRTITIAQVVQEVKTSSSKWMKDRWSLPGFAWQAGYGAFSVSPGDVEAAVAYIRNQEQHHRKLSFQDEYRELLRLAGVPCDERYMWD